MTLNPWRLAPLNFWSVRMIPRYLFVLPVKMLIVAPATVIFSFFYIALVYKGFEFGHRLQGITMWLWRVFLSVSLEVEDRRTEEQKGQAIKIAVLNHVSYVDGFIVGSVFKKYRTIAASWAFDTPIYGHWLKATGSIPLYRGRGSSDTAARIHSDDSEYTITLTSEGTMTNGLGLIRFRTGAFVGGVPVLPFVIFYQNDEFNNSWIKTTSPLWKHLIMMVSQVRNPVKVLLLAPYHPSDEEKKDPVLFSENVRKYMSDGSGLPLIDAGYKESPALRAPSGQP